MRCWRAWVPVSIGLLRFSGRSCGNCSMSTDAGVEETVGGRAVAASDNDDDDTELLEDADLPLDLSCRTSTTDVQSTSSLLTASQHLHTLQLDFLARRSLLI